MRDEIFTVIPDKEIPVEDEILPPQVSEAGRGKLRVTEAEIRRKIRNFLFENQVRQLHEADIEELADICYVPGSTHVMATCTLGGGKYYLKFSEDALFYEFDPSLQILIEYLAYRIYGLYSGIRIPRPELVYDRSRKRVGLATSPASGRPVTVWDPEIVKLGRAMSEGVYVDIFLANWDVVGTGTANVFMDDAGATRIDPGGSLTFRAQGGRKGSKFSKSAGELSTMMDFRGAGRVFQYSDLSVAAKEFLSVPWERIEREIKVVGEEVSFELRSRDMMNLLGQWRADIENILDTLEARHDAVAASAEMILES